VSEYNFEVFAPIPCPRCFGYIFPAGEQVETNGLPQCSCGNNAGNDFSCQSVSAGLYGTEMSKQFEQQVLASLGRIERNLSMATNSVAALQAAIATLQSTVTGEDSAIAAIIAALQAASPIGDNPAIDAVVTQLGTLQTDVTTQTAAITAALPAPATPSAS
jgi:hypothetical protein